VDFFSAGLQFHPPDALHGAVSDESWGIDNVLITASTVVPEPGTWVALAGGLWWLAYRGGRRSSRLLR
jgi:hypothetical protein